MVNKFLESGNDGVIRQELVTYKRLEDGRVIKLTTVRTFFSNAEYDETFTKVVL